MRILWISVVVLAAALLFAVTTPAEDTSTGISDQPVRSAEEAEKLAWAILNQRAGAFISGKGECEASTLRPAERERLLGGASGKAPEPDLAREIAFAMAGVSTRGLLPYALAARGRGADAKRLRSLAPIRDRGSLRSALKAVRSLSGIASVGAPVQATLRVLIAADQDSFSEAQMKAVGRALCETLRQTIDAGAPRQKAIDLVIPR